MNNNLLRGYIPRSPFSYLKNTVIVSILILPFLSSSCLEKADPIAEQESFLRIYDNSNFSEEFTPIDMKQTVDEGYLILASKRLPDSNFSGVYLLKVDKTGALLKEVNDFDTQYVHPTGALTEISGAYYFFCMRADNQEVQLVTVASDATVQSITPVAGLTYPTVSALDGSNLLLLSYNNVDRVMNVSQVTAGGVTNVDNSVKNSIGVGDETEEPIINHFIQGNKKFPFEVGRIAGGNVFYNGFYNYTFSLVFTALSPSEPTGVVYGQQDDGGFSAVKSLGGSKFALARFNFGDNFLIPDTTLSTNSITIGTDLDGYSLPELQANANVKLLSITSGQKNAIVFGSNTQSKQIALLFYNELDGSFINSRYLGFSNPFEIGSMLQTIDGGMAICGITYVAGRFPRICLFKLSKEELDDLIE
jgi:hypothetical protein